MTISLICSTPSDGIFFAGELFQCLITITNNATESGGGDQGTNIEKSPIKQQSSLFGSRFIYDFLTGITHSKTPESTPTKDNSNPNTEADNLANDLERFRPNQNVADDVKHVDNHFETRQNIPREGAHVENNPSAATATEDYPITGVGTEKGGVLNLSLKPIQAPTVKVHSRNTSFGDLDDQPSVTTQSNFSPDRSSPHDFDKSSRPSYIPFPIDTKIGTSKQGKKATLALAYAQMTGQFTFDNHYIVKDAFTGLADRVIYGTPGMQSNTGGVYGGGSLATNSVHHKKSQKPVLNALPLYNTPPSILFCDLELEPGESKSFRYEVLLPSVLPPSHRGKIIRFQYKLLVGIQKSFSATGNSKNQIFSIPFRFFNRTNADGSRSVFEILNPVIHTKDMAVVTPLSSADALLSPRPSTSFTSPQLGLTSGSGNNVSESVHSSMASKLEADHQTNSADNVINILQNSGKVSYDICKNNEHIAQLVMGRLGYRLGESVTAVLDFTKSSIPCFHASVFLEWHEQVDAVYASKPKELIKQHTRVCVGEFHQQTLNSRRTAIVLNIPSKATPDFQSSVASIVWTLRFEFITGLGGRVLRSVADYDGFHHERGVNEVAVEPFDCTIPLKVYAALKTSKKHRKILDFDFE